MVYFGFDPELFLMAKNARSKATSVHLADINYGSLSSKDDAGVGVGYIHAKSDGFAFELNSKADTCRDRIVPYTGALLRDFYNKYPDWKLSAVPVRRLTAASMGGDVPEGVNEFGCLPDRDGYTLQEKTPFRSDYEDDRRYLGGHLHLKMSNTNSLSVAAFAVFLDIDLAIPLVSMLGRSNDYGEADRRRYYGQAGSYRLKDYGIEYRVPSGAILLSPILLSWAFGQLRHTHGRFTYTKGINGNEATLRSIMVDLNKRFDFDAVRSIINNHDVDGARAFMKFHKTHYDGSLYLPKLHKLLVRADKAQIGFPTNMYDAWALDPKGRIRNHGYFGCEMLVSGYDEAAKKAYRVDLTSVPQIKVMQKETKEWSF